DAPTGRAVPSAARVRGVADSRSCSILRANDVGEGVHALVGRSHDHGAGYDPAAAAADALLAREAEPSRRAGRCGVAPHPDPSGFHGPLTMVPVSPWRSRSDPSFS